VLETFISRFENRSGGEEGLRFLVNSTWLKSSVPGLSSVQVEHAGSFDPLATHELLQSKMPYVAITNEDGLIMKVIDRVGVATEIARTVVARQLGRS
jgi:hypothetical protein